MKNTFSRFATLTAALTLVPALAQAHPGHGTDGFSAGLAHPVLGADHVLAMLAVGLWAVQLGGRAKWAVPAAFVSVMSLGGLLGAAGVSLPLAEPAIAASVLILGVMIAAAVRLPLAAGAALVGVFALFHGQAHGAEIPATAGALAYIAGFVATTAALMACGSAAGMMAQGAARASVARLAGAAIALCGMVLIFN